MDNLSSLPVSPPPPPPHCSSHSTPPPLQPPSVDATLENGINYNLCFSGNFPLDLLGAINAEVDIVGYLDAKVEREANAKDVRTPGCTAI